MRPHFASEQQLLTMQYKRRWSLFSCDEAAVYSNQAITLGPGFRTGVVASNLVCGKGGEFGTALNTPIFLKVWAKVREDGDFMRHEWTVKVDPDAVFVPDRLRKIVAYHRESQRGVYFNNCKYGMHGPLEVFSRNAVVSWTSYSQQCVQHFWKVCEGPCKWGEDMFIDQCLWKVLMVDRHFDVNLLREDHCDPPAGWKSCQDAAAVAFHPFKDAAMYEDCANIANNVDLLDGSA